MHSGRANALTRARNSPFTLPFAELTRRKFLRYCCQGATAALVPATCFGFPFRSHPSAFFAYSPSPSSADFHFHPNYRAPSPLAATLLKTQAGSDDFITEKFHDQIAPILANWNTSLLRSPDDMVPIESFLADDFAGSSALPEKTQIIRDSGALEIKRNWFSPKSILSNQFIHDLRSSLSSFSRLLTAEFQITSIVAHSVSDHERSRALSTHVRYELVGEGSGFYREQRVGEWVLDWISTSSSEVRFKLKAWQFLEETRSRTRAPAFLDITSAAFPGVSSYAEQMSRGADYWRTVLDSACGIDLYGHNGVSAADIDNDGFDDLYICQPAGLPNRLYRNRGDGSFEDITEASGLGLLDNTACALFADFDNDGRQDVVVVRANGPLLFLNQGGGKFRQQPEAFQFANSPQGTFTGAAVADYDRDGWLDIYFCLYAYYQGAGQYRYPVPYHDAENGPPNFLMRNNRDGTFRDVTAASGLDQNNTRYSFCCGWGDYNRDGWPDLYVVNDFGRKNLYRNNGNGTFTDVALEMGVEDVGAGMSVGWLDYDNDGAEDLYVADMWSAAGERVSAQEIFKKDSPPEIRALYRRHAMGNSLFRNQGDKFASATDAAGVGMGRWSWSSDAFDFDHDGFQDLYIANGMVSGDSREDLNSFFWRQVVANSPDRAMPSQPYEQGWNAINELIRADGTWSGFERNVFYANHRDGTFSNVSGAIGMDFVEDGRAFILADIDHDGRQELLLKNRNAPQLRLLKNVIDKLPPAIAVNLRGNKSNRDAIGARVTVETELGTQTRMLQTGSGFLSQHSKESFFGLGEAKSLVRLSVRWPSGLEQHFSNLPANHRVWIEEASEAVRSEAFRSVSKSDSISEAPPQPPELLPNVVETWLLVPLPAPDFSLPDLSGQALTLSALRGQCVLLNFWSTNVKDGDATLKTFELLHARRAELNLQLLTVNLDEDASAEKLRLKARERKLTFPILLGSDDVAAIYNLLYRYLYDRHRDLPLPVSFLIDANGEIVKVYQGPVNAERVAQDCRTIPRTNQQRMSRALPFPGASASFEYERNYLSLGSIFFQRGYFEQSVSSFQLAVRDDPTSAEGFYGLGSAYLNRHQTSEARDCFEQATRLKANYPDTIANSWNNLGLIATQENDSAGAIHYFQEALRQSPNHLIALNNLGNAYRMQKNWQEARKIFERALQLDPAGAEANYGLAMVFAQADDAGQTYKYLTKALQSRPDYPEALNNLAILYLRTGRQEQAVATFQDCMDLAPEFDQCYLNLARVFALEGESDHAREVLMQLLKQHPNHAAAQNMLAQIAKQ